MSRISQTLRTPGGNKVRYQGKRRYVLVHGHTPAPDLAGLRKPSARIVQRSDDLDTIRAGWRRKGGATSHYTDGAHILRSIIDTTTGHVVPPTA